MFLKHPELLRFSSGSPEPRGEAWAANAVVNADLPWNPAKLEQRIARAWRKGQMRAVTVVNLVAEDSIEHAMVHLLGAKQALADGVLDGRGDLAELKMPSGRAAMIERIEALMRARVEAPATVAVPPAVKPAEEIAAEDLRDRHGEQALRIEAHRAQDGRKHLLAVLDADRATLAREARRLAKAAAADNTGEAEGCAPSIEVIDRATWAVLQRLQASGVIQFVGEATRLLHQAPALADGAAVRLAAAQAARLRALAERQLAKASVLAAGGFPEEVPALLTQAIGHAAAARMALLSELAANETCASPAQVRDLVDRNELPPEAAAMLDRLSASTVPSTYDTERLLAAAADIVSVCAE